MQPLRPIKKYSWISTANILIFIGTFLGLIEMSRYPLPRIDFNCSYIPITVPQLVVSDKIYSVPLRNPFFVPIKEVEVGVEKVDVETKKTAQEAQGLFVYKGMMDWGGDKVAIIYVIESKKTKFLKLGDFVEGYKVLDITEDTVVLSKEGGLSLITLKVGGSK